MLRCSNYKCDGSPHQCIEFEAAILPIFYQRLNRGALSDPTLALFAHGPIRWDIRFGESVFPGGALRQLAGDFLCRGDQALYLLTAEALEKRAEWLAFTYPQRGCETLPQERSRQPDSPELHKPVDVTI